MQMAADRVASFAMTAEELVETLKELGANEGGETEGAVSSIVTAEDLAKGLARAVQANNAGDVIGDVALLRFQRNSAPSCA